MWHFSFSHLLFVLDPMKTLAFFSLVMCYFSLWIKKSGWVWGSFLVISLVLALQSSVIEFEALLPIGLSFVLYRLLKTSISGLLRYIVVTLAFLLTGSLFFHFLPGFHNWALGKNLSISPHALPYHFYFNYDKPIGALFILTFTLPLLHTAKQWRTLLAKILLPTLAGICILLFLSFSLHIVAWDPKIPIIAFIWPIANLFFVVIPEEALLRGLLQKELSGFLGTKLSSQVASVVITSLVFTLFHLAWVAELPFLLLVFVAGLIYGGLYQWTKAIESSILCHYLVNVLHFMLFTYPMLKP